MHSLNYLHSHHYFNMLIFYNLSDMKQSFFGLGNAVDFHISLCTSPHLYFFFHFFFQTGLHWLPYRQTSLLWQHQTIHHHHHLQPYQHQPSKPLPSRVSQHLRSPPPDCRLRRPCLQPQLMKPIAISQFPLLTPPRPRPLLGRSLWWWNKPLRDQPLRAGPATYTSHQCLSPK